MIASTSAQPLSLPLRTPSPVARIPVRAPESRPRFTLDGSRELEDHLDRTCARIAAGVRGLIPRRRLEAILLGGGYGRGEGGVLRTPAGDRPYNDLEFYVFVRGNRHLNEARFGRALHVLGEILTPQAGIEVEFKITSMAELAARPVSMFSYDLLSGHQRLAGSEDILALGAHHRDPAQIPLSEATRLLMNRCSGLLFARERLARPIFTAADADFVRRNIAKAELALGDAVLVALGRYHWSARERHRLLERIAAVETPPWLGEVLRRHASGLEFKLHPERSAAGRDDLAAAHRPVMDLAAEVWLWIEKRRLQHRFDSIREYLDWRGAKWPESSGPRNILLNAKALGRSGLRANERLTRHPRERILNALGWLLWEPAVSSDRRLLGRVQRELRSPAETLPELVRAYQEIWSRVN